MSMSFFCNSCAIGSLTYLLLSQSGVVAADSPYTLNTSYSGTSFFDGFDFFEDADPTNGFVTYVNQPTALLNNLISSSNNAPAYIGVDFATYITNMTQGRSSVRIESKQTFTHALIISDIEHMPGGICGTWPAHWTLGPDWPSHGEIDIIEGVNSGSYQDFKNLISLHTSPGCTTVGANETGTLQTSNCDTTINYNSGCGVLSSMDTSYGFDFNNEGGGVYATEWTSDFITVWFFPRYSIPPDITAGQPQPSLWGLPQANFQGSCNIDSKFGDHKIIFDTTFCGDYAGTDWGDDSVCRELAMTCNDYVAQNPGVFQNAFWSINSVNVYQQAVSSPSSTQSLSSTVPKSSVLAPGMGYSNSSSSSTMSTSPSSTITTAPTTTPFASSASTASATTALTTTALTTTALTTTALTTAVSTTTALTTALNTTVFNTGTFKYLGCASSPSGFSTFSEVNDTLDMTLQKCISECDAGSYMYAGIFTSRCYCATSLSSDVTVTPGQGSCTKSCPGNVSQFCGGGVLAQAGLEPRQIQSGMLLSLYAKTALSPTSVVPQSSVFGYGMGGGASNMTSTAISVIYVDVCDECVNGFRTISTTFTVELCGCREIVALPTIPMATVTKSCEVCGESGGPAVVTVTVPSVSVLQTPLVTSGLSVLNRTSMTLTAGPAKFTGGSIAVGMNVGLTIAGLILIILLR